MTNPIDKRPAIFLDRDGVINEAIVRDGKPYPPQTIADLVWVPRVKEALKLLRQEGFFLVIVTNQPDVGRGTLSQDAVESIHSHMQDVLLLDDVRVCYDDGRKVNTINRKPGPGMILDAAREHDLDLSASYMIGDRWRDVEAGLDAGCTTIFIDYQYRESLRRPPDYVVSSLWQAVQLIVSDEHGACR